MANAKQINELNEATSVSATTKIAVAQPNGTEAEAATVSTLAAGVGEVLNTGAFAELTYATSQGKNAIATVLTNKGVETAASETLIQMADKVNNLNVESNVTNIKARVWASAVVQSQNGNSWICSAKLFNKRDFILFVNGMLYYIPDGAYSSLEEMISASSFSLDTGIIVDGNNNVYFTMCVSANNNYLLIRAATANNLHLYKINSDSFGIVNDNITTTTSTIASTSYPSFIAVSDDGKVIAYCSTKNIILYNIETSTEFSFSTSIFNRGGHFFIKNNKVYALSHTSSGNLTGKVQIWSYEITSEGVITAIKDMESAPFNTSAQCNIFHSDSAVYYMAMTRAATSDTKLGAYDIYSLYFCELDQMISTAPTPAQFKSFPIEVTEVGISNNGYSMTLSAQINDIGETVEISFPNMLPDEKFIYNKATRTVTSSKEIHITHPGQYGLQYRALLDANGNYMVLGANSQSILFRAGQGYSSAILLDGEKIIAKKMKKLDGAEVYYVAGNVLRYSSAKAGYYDADIQIAPELPAEE